MTGWFEACGDETCACCGKGILEGQEAHYNKATDKTLCMPCKEDAENTEAGLWDALTEAAYA